ncbi:hypothetical protein IWZ03DRAFT_441884 [Phyllosticta citriasiana]|uniref:Uncharacterized protein n=1 Tax=Phyllosticta citriasiana TaxID=595635 RepID=A0ABR1KIV5_9PEZI
MACHAILARSVALLLLLLLLLPRRKNPNPITRLGCREGRFIGPGQAIPPHTAQRAFKRWWRALQGKQEAFPNAADDAKRRQYRPADIDDDFLDQRRPSCPHDVFPVKDRMAVFRGTWLVSDEPILFDCPSQSYHIRNCAGRVGGHGEGHSTSAATPRPATISPDLTPGLEPVDVIGPWRRSSSSSDALLRPAAVALWSAKFRRLQRQ